MWWRSTAVSQRRMLLMLTAVLFPMYWVQIRDGPALKVTGLKVFCVLFFKHCMSSLVNIAWSLCLDPSFVTDLELPEILQMLLVLSLQKYWCFSDFVRSCIMYHFGIVYSPVERKLWQILWQVKTKNSILLVAALFVTTQINLKAGSTHTDRIQGTIHVMHTK